MYGCKHSHTQTKTQGRGVFLFVFFTFHTGGSGSGGARHLPGETGTLDGLRALLNLILITAAMDGHHLTRPLLHLVWDWERQRRKNWAAGTASNRLLRWLTVTVSFSTTLKFKLEWMCTENNNQINTTVASPWIKQICWIIYLRINPSVYSGLTLLDS